MISSTPECTDKSPILAAIEDSVLVFIYSLLVALSAVVLTDNFTWSLLLMPVIVAGIQACLTWARVRGVQMPTQKEEGGG